MYKRRWKDEIMCGFEGTGKEQESGDWCLFFFCFIKKERLYKRYEWKKRRILTYKTLF